MNHQSDRKEMNQMRRSGTSGWQENSRRLHRHAPSMEQHLATRNAETSTPTLSWDWGASS